MDDMDQTPATCTAWVDPDGDRCGEVAIVTDTHGDEGRCEIHLEWYRDPGVDQRIFNTTRKAI